MTGPDTCGNSAVRYYRNDYSRIVVMVSSCMRTFQKREIYCFLTQLYAGASTQKQTGSVAARSLHCPPQDDCILRIDGLPHSGRSLSTPLPVNKESFTC